MPTGVYIRVCVHEQSTNRQSIRRWQRRPYRPVNAAAGDVVSTNNAAASSSHRRAAASSFFFSSSSSSSSEDDHQTRVIPDPRVEPEGRQGRQDWLAPNRLPNPLNYTAIKEEESGGVMMAA